MTSAACRGRHRCCGPIKRCMSLDCQHVVGGPRACCDRFVFSLIPSPPNNRLVETMPCVCARRAPGSIFRGPVIVQPFASIFFSISSLISFFSSGLGSEIRRLVRLCLPVGTMFHTTRTTTWCPRPVSATTKLRTGSLSARLYLPTSVPLAFRARLCLANDRVITTCVVGGSVGSSEPVFDLIRAPIRAPKQARIHDREPGKLERRPRTQTRVERSTSEAQHLPDSIAGFTAWGSSVCGAGLPFKFPPFHQMGLPGSRS